MVVKFSELKTIIDRLDKTIPNYEKENTHVLIKLEDVSDNPIKISCKEPVLLNKLKISYNKEKYRIILNGKINGNLYDDIN